MSQENVEIVQRWNAAYNRRDMKTLLALTAFDFEFQSIFVAIESVTRGHEGVHAYFEAVDDAYDRFDVIPNEFIDAGAAVVVLADAYWRGKESGAEGKLPLAITAWLRTGKVFRVETFKDRGEAMRAVGLSEQDAQADS